MPRNIPEYPGSEFCQHSGLSLKEGLDFLYLVLRHRTSDLILCHHGNSLLESLHATIVVVRPGEGHIPQ